MAINRCYSVSFALMLLCYAVWSDIFSSMPFIVMMDNVTLL